MEFDQLDALVRGTGIGIILLVGGQMARGLPSSRHAQIGFLFCLGIAAYIICSASWFLDLPGVIVGPIFTLCIFNPLIFWLFAQSVFDDHLSIGRTQRAVITTFAVVGIANLLVWLFPNAPFTKLLFIIHQIFSLALIFHILFDIARGHAGDLIELRRKIRTYAVFFIGAYITLVLVGEITLAGEQPSDLLNLLNVTMITLLALGIGSALIQIRTEFAVAEQRQTDAPTRSPTTAAHEEDSAEQNALIKEISALFDTHFAYRQEGLTVASLAKRLRVPEYRVRRAINQGMGYRNFNSFLNHHRLTDVEASLNDPQKARLPILTIAFDAGFGSLAPFNKAFKERTGMTPTVFREQNLAKRHD